MLVTGANLVGVAVVVRGGTVPLVRLPRYGGQHDRDHRDHSEHVGKADADDELDVVTAHVTSKLYSVARTMTLAVRTPSPRPPAAVSLIPSPASSHRASGEFARPFACYCFADLPYVVR